MFKHLFVCLYFIIQNRILIQEIFMKEIFKEDIFIEELRADQDAMKSLVNSYLYHRCYKPVETIVYVTHNSNNQDLDVYYLPRATLLHRCSDESGCCSDGRMSCQMIQHEIVEIGFFVVIKYANGTFTRETELIQMVNHTECACLLNGWMVNNGMMMMMSGTGNSFSKMSSVSTENSIANSTKLTTQYYEGPSTQETTSSTSTRINQTLSSKTHIPSPRTTQGPLSQATQIPTHEISTQTTPLTQTLSSQTDSIQIPSTKTTSNQIPSTQRTPSTQTSSTQTPSSKTTFQQTESTSQETQTTSSQSSQASIPFQTSTLTSITNSTTALRIPSRTTTSTSLLTTSTTKSSKISSTTSSTINYDELEREDDEDKEAQNDIEFILLN